MKNHYETLGVGKTANSDEIKRAYRKLAGKYHPDKGGDKNKFQEIQAAYGILGDDQKRAQYDNPGQFGGFGRQDTPFDMDAIFNMFGARFQHGHQQHRQQARMALWITLIDSAQGGARTISVGTQQGTHAVEIEIPQGINDGDNVQYSGVGPGGMDLVITYRIHPNPRWQRQGQNLITEHSVSIWELILGCDTALKDILGNTLMLTVPPQTQPGSVLRLRGRGLASKNNPAGDLLVRIQGQIPNDIDPELLAAIEKNKAP